MLNVPIGVLADVCSFSVELVAVVPFGLKAAATPAGKPVAASVTLSAYISRLIFIVNVADCPATTVCAVGDAESETPAAKASAENVKTQKAINNEYKVNKLIFFVLIFFSCNLKSFPLPTI